MNITIVIKLSEIRTEIDVPISKYFGTRINDKIRLIIAAKNKIIEKLFCLFIGSIVWMPKTLLKNITNGSQAIILKTKTDGSYPFPKIILTKGFANKNNVIEITVPAISAILNNFLLKLMNRS